MRNDQPFGRSLVGRLVQNSGWHAEAVYSRRRHVGPSERNNMAAPEYGVRLATASLRHATRKNRRGNVLVCLCLAALVSGADRPREPHRPERRQSPTTTSAPATTQPASQPAETKDKPIPLSFSNAPLGEIAKFLTERLGKPVLIAKDVSGTQLTVTNPKPLPPADAMYVLVTALHEAGVAIEEREKTVHLIPIAQIIQAQLPTYGAQIDVKKIEPASQIVRKTFLVRHQDASKLLDSLKSLLPGWSQITADAASGRLIVVSTVERLRVLVDVIEQLDAPDVSGGELRVFAIKNVDVNEILPTLEKLVSSYLGIEVKAVTAAGTGAGAGGAPRSERSERGGPDHMPGPPGGPPGPPPTPPPSAGAAVTVRGEKLPVLLIPEPRRSSIVVVAPAHVLAQIEKWLVHLDLPKPPSTQTELVEVQFGDPDELVSQLNSTLNSIPDESLRNAVRIQPFGASRKIMIIGSEQNRQQIKAWLKEIDVTSGVVETKTFNLKNADAQQVSENIKELFGEQQQGRFGYYFGYYERRSGGAADRTKVTVTYNSRSNSVTVVASPERLAKIAEQIVIWDQPLDAEEAKPRIYDLKFADPDKTKTLLENLFTKKEANATWRPWFDEEMPKTASPVGRLFGQFRFEAYPDTGKLVVVSKNEENYAVIDRMVKEIDSPQSGGIPRIIQLKFADAETLAEQLNALLNAPGTPASILRRGQTGTFKELADRESPYSTNTGNSPANSRTPEPPSRNQRGGTGEMQFWWQNPPSDLVKNRQPSNLVGKLRIVPNVEQNLLMVAAPEEFADAIEKFVADLDRPGQQVLIRGLIAEITHDDTTSLGYRFSTDPTAFTTGSDANITENALRGLLSYSFKDTFGQQHTLSFNIDVNNLLSLLRRVTNLKIRSEPKVFTADNVEAEFFDGQDIPFIKDSYYNANNLPQQSFDYKAVGIRLRVRPHITKERNIDLTVNLLVSSTIPGRTLFGGAVVDRRETTTRIVLKDGRTFLISGILREEDNEIIRHVPGAADIPIIGEAFKHREIVKVNTELLIFLTPYVIGSEGPHDPVESEPLRRLREQLQQKQNAAPPEGELPAGHTTASAPASEIQEQ